MLWRSFPHSASTRTPQPNKRQSVGAGRVGAIRRDHAARQCSAAHLGRVAALCTPCSLSGRLFTRCSSDLAVQLNKRTRRTKNACSNTRTALLVHGSAGMISAGSRRGSSHALVPWNREQAWSASGPSGGHAFSGRTDSNRLNTEQQIGHASVTRSRTLVLGGRPRSSSSFAWRGRCRRQPAKHRPPSRQLFCGARGARRKLSTGSHGSHVCGDAGGGRGVQGRRSPTPPMMGPMFELESSEPSEYSYGAA